MIAWRPENFLYVLNGFLLDESKEPQRKTPQEQMEGGPSFRFSPKKKIDLVLHAPCPLSGDHRYTIRSPMGPGFLGGAESESVLHDIIKEYSPKEVLVIPRCCGPVRNSSYGYLAPMAFQGIVWHFPDVRDLGDEHFRSDSLIVPLIIKDLLDAGTIIFQ